MLEVLKLQQNHCQYFGFGSWEQVGRYLVRMLNADVVKNCELPESCKASASRCGCPCQSLAAPRPVLWVQTDAMPFQAKAAGTPLAGLKAACAEQCASQLSAIRIRSTAELDFNFKNLEPHQLNRLPPTRLFSFPPTSENRYLHNPYYFAICLLSLSIFDTRISLDGSLGFYEQANRSHLHFDPLLIPRDNRISCLPSSSYL